MKVKANLNIKHPKKIYKIGDIIELEVDNNNQPVEQFWRRRLEDAKIDNCIEILKSNKTNKSKVK